MSRPDPGRIETVPSKFSAAAGYGQYAAGVQASTCAREARGPTWFSAECFVVILDRLESDDMTTKQAKHTKTIQRKQVIHRICGLSQIVSRMIGLKIFAGRKEENC
jgi:hypothetical protein